MITQYSICFLILLLSWSKCLNSCPATLELFLNLKKSKFKKTAAFSAARIVVESFLTFPLLFLHFLSLSLWLLDFSVHLSHQEPCKLLSHQHSVLHFPSFSLVEESPAGKGRKTRFQPSAFLSVYWSADWPLLPWREFTQVLVKGNACTTELAT